LHYDFYSDGLMVNEIKEKLQAALKYKTYKNKGPTPVLVLVGTASMLLALH